MSLSSSPTLSSQTEESTAIVSSEPKVGVVTPAKPKNKNENVPTKRQSAATMASMHDTEIGVVSGGNGNINDTSIIEGIASFNMYNEPNEPLTKEEVILDAEEDAMETEMVPLTRMVSDDDNANSTNTNTKSSKWFWSKCRGRRKKSNNSNSTVGNAIEGKGSDLTDVTGKIKSPPNSPSSKKVTEQLKGIARFFSSSQETNEYAPSGPIVASAGIDLCMPVLFNFHLFMLASKASNYDGNGDDDNEDDDDDYLPDYNSIPPQVLPLIFLSILFVRVVIPWKARSRFWSTIHSTISSPFYSVGFRDAFLGDVLTSLVRPIQDCCFAIFYYFASMYGIFTGKVSLEDTGSRLTHNILLHNVVLPTCAVLPLLCRFLQTLRQAYDEQRRWPHLGNAFKYLSASLVISYGMTHSEDVRSPLWIFSFVSCAFYQIWWDVLIDWELIRITSKEESGGIFIPVIGRIQLRSKRLFKSERSYWKIMILNGLFRFTWMLSFIPAYHLSSGEIKNTFSKDVKSVVGFVVSLAELMRRSAWCILKLELETIKKTDEDYVSGAPYSVPSSRIQYPWFAPSDKVVETAIGQSPFSQRMGMKRTAYKLLVKKLFILELVVWAAAYVGLGMVVSVYF